MLEVVNQLMEGENLRDPYSPVPNLGFYLKETHFKFRKKILALGEETFL